MEKNWNAMEKLWKSYGISFLEICTNPAYIFYMGGGGGGVFRPKHTIYGAYEYYTQATGSNNYNLLT